MFSREDQDSTRVSYITACDVLIRSLEEALLWRSWFESRFEFFFSMTFYSHYYILVEGSGQQDVTPTQERLRLDFVILVLMKPTV